MTGRMLRFQVNVDCTGPADEAAVAALRSWVDLGLSTVAARYMARIAAQPPLAADVFRTGAAYGQAGTAWGWIGYSVPNRHGRRRTVGRVYSDAEYARFQSQAGGVLAFGDRITNVLLQVGTLTPSHHQLGIDRVDIRANLPEAAANTLLLTLDFPPGNLDGEVVAAWRRWVDEHAVTFGVVERAVAFVDTVLEDSVNVPRYSLLYQLRERLRGYGWLTIASPEVGDRLGGVDALRATGAFAEVARTRSGSYWLRATTDPHSYGMADAERVFRAVAPVLPPGMPYPSEWFEGELPYLIVLEDASTVTAG
jgi:hypothetical protein